MRNLGFAILLTACGTSTSGTAPALRGGASVPAPVTAPGHETREITTPVSTSSAPLATGPRAQRVGKTLVFRGMCDASGAVVLGAPRFAVGDDEDNVLRVYDADRGGEAVHAVDVSPSLDLPVKKRTPEADIEAATRIGDHALWVTSHGLNSKGKLQPGRFRLFATNTPENGEGLTAAGRPYDALLSDMLATPALAQLGLEPASHIAPKEPGGLNIEGMTEREGTQSVFVGFRSPRPHNRAIVVPFDNPLEVIEGAHAKLGEPLLLDLGGLGVRGLSAWRGRYLIIGGALAQEAPSKLFVWDGKSVKPTPVALDLEDINPEAFVTFEERDEILLLSDDGSLMVGEKACKKVDASLKTFRGVWVKLS